MKRLVIIIILAILMGCQTKDFKATIVAEGQPSPHDGYNIGPDIWVEEGTPVKLSGAVVWINGLDPNSIEEAIVDE